MAEFILPKFLESLVNFPETNTSYDIIKPLTGIRSCHDAKPAERRILFTCRKLPSTSQSAQHNGSGDIEEEFVMKVKIQEPGTPSPDPQPGPSDMTGAELKALETFTAAENAYVPRLVTWKRAAQGANGPLPGGYVIYTIMTKVPGETLFAMQYWTLLEAEHEVIRREFLRVLSTIHALGIEPIDRGLRNILWDRPSQRCSIIDFELWRAIPVDSKVPDETKELQRWGLQQHPPVKGWFDAWAMGQQ